MATEKDDDIDAIENTETGKKAEEIGKELGVEKDDTPEYDIQEEDDSPADERIAKEREPRKEADKKERKILTNKEKRELRKKRVNDKFNEKDAIIAAQQEKLQQLESWKNEVDGRLSGINKAEVDKAFNATVAAFAQAEKDHADAFAEGDGQKATKAMRVMYEAQRQIEQLQGMKQQLDKQPMQAQQSQPESHVDRIIANKVQSWEADNPWFKKDKNGNGIDDDSEVALALSARLVREGYDPKSDVFWDELDDRLADRLPEKVARDEEEEVEKPRKRSAPPVNGGANRSDLKGKKTITLPTSYINTLKANGIWDDPVRMKKIIADRERILKESQ